MKLSATKYLPFAVIALLLAVGFVFSNAQEDEAAKAAAEPTVGKPADITISPKALTDSPKPLPETTPGSGTYLTNQNSIFVDVSVKVAGMAGKLVVLSGNGRTIGERDVSSTDSPTTVENVTLSENETNTVSARFTSTNNPATNKPYSVTSNTIFIKCDTIGPRLQHAEVIDVPSTGITLVATFDDGDFDKETLKDAFEVSRQDKDGKFGTDKVSIQGTPVIAERTIRLSLATSFAGQYQLTIKDNVLKDIAGNSAGGGPWTFSVLAERKFGEHVEFPPFTPPQKQAIPDEGFNPADFVETRVARLYYYRDAARVAQILNRNIRSYNQAAVTQAERRAEQSRDDADNATDTRRKSEREAVRAAEQARNAEQKLAAAREVLSEAQGLQNEIAADEMEKGKADTTDERKKELEVRITANTASLAKFGDIETLEGNVMSMEQSVANLRQTELVKRDASDDSDAKEARARAKQFRDEVSAAETDPDTYVAGDIHSVDPVTQVSISVIGEGLIQLRGPIKGINKIRTMINDIDSPVGQIKIGIFTVQVNGEKGDKMEKVIGDAEGYIDLSRFLVNHSLELLRKAIQSEAAMIASQCDQGGHYQVDRDRRYLYSFFGRDFIDELYAMNSEFLNSENKLLSLHAMDTVSLNRALFILALAKNDVRERIVARFLESAKTELADAEYDFRRSSDLNPHHTQKRLPPWNLVHLPVCNKAKVEEMIYEAVHRNAMQRYHFRNLSGFFEVGFTNPDTMNPMQREFIRLAQIFKARLVAEMEWKQRVMERGLIEDRSNDENLRYELLKPVHKRAIELEKKAYEQLVEAGEMNLSGAKKIDEYIREALNGARDAEKLEALRNEVLTKGGLNFKLNGLFERIEDFDKEKVEARKLLKEANDRFFQPMRAALDKYERALWLTEAHAEKLRSAIDLATTFEESYKSYSDAQDPTLDEAEVARNAATAGLADSLVDVVETFTSLREQWKKAERLLREYRLVAENPSAQLVTIEAAYEALYALLTSDKFEGSAAARNIVILLEQSYSATFNGRMADQRIEQARVISKKTRGELDHRKLLNHLIDEQEEKFIELVEGTRSHIAVMDQYLKRLSIALEDDFKVQFYDPAFVRVRDAARSEAVNLGQVERTTILTNNRAFAKVDPQATMEFDLPKRQIAIKEAFDAAKALVEDTGALVNDPTFLAAFQMMGGSTQPTTVKNVVPGQSTSTDQQSMGLVPQQQESGAPGSALQNLVPEPAIYKLETGTGFQIRPVMQPDGDSVVYDFDYMYTTNIREPVRADEKHLGRIKRHFVHTAVQTGNYEMREISRYQVALKISRTGQGVPLLQDIPLVGAAFKPAPSAESSIQQNIILGQTNVYPTLFDLMGLRWAQQVVDLDHTSLLETEHVIRGRQQSIRDYVFDTASKRVDNFLDIRKESPEHYRPDFYHTQTLPSPHHPGGYVYPKGRTDPTGNGYERSDRRPEEMQVPPYDRYRHQPVYPERIGPQAAPESIPLDRLNLEPIELNAPTGESDGSSRRRNYQPTPQINEGAAIYRDSVHDRDPAVVPAGFERAERPPRNSQIRRLPPVR